MTWDTLHHSPSQAQALLAIRDHVRAHPGVAVLDLDGCLLDNRPREIRILREYALLHGAYDLLSVELRHIEDWDLAHVLGHAGLSEDRVLRLIPSLQAFWKERFFLGAYAIHDEPLPGAPAFVRALVEAGCRIVYLSGRVETSREGTQTILARFGFPLAAAGARLVLRPDEQEGMRVFKDRALTEIARDGTVTLLLEDIPENLRDFSARFPGALAVWMATGLSHLHARCPAQALRVRGFLS